jgi:hypothetical protein
MRFGGLATCDARLDAFSIAVLRCVDRGIGHEH